MYIVKRVKDGKTTYWLDGVWTESRENACLYRSARDANYRAERAQCSDWNAHIMVIPE